MSAILDDDKEIPLRDCACGAAPEYLSANGLAHVIRCPKCLRTTQLERCRYDAVSAWNGNTRQEAKVSNCELCGEPMPEHEQMFKFHGYSGPCPKPPLPKPKIGVIVEHIYRDQGGEFWIDFHVDRRPYSSLGPFSTDSERKRVHDELLSMLRSVGATDVPNVQQ